MVVTKVISAIEFGVFSPEQVRTMSAAKITVPDTYDEDGYPITGGLADQRLGVIDPGLKCNTCGGRMKTCSGHFGHIELVRPVIHVGFGKTVYQLLKGTCRKCNRLLNPGETLEKLKKVSECPHCGEKQKPVKFVKPTSFYEEERRLLPNEVRERLERIPDEDIRTVGLRVRPEWMILTALIVPPVTVRPSITLETGERSEDDLTHKLVDILRINQRLGENIDAGAPQLIIEDLWELLQYHIATYFDNESPSIPPARHRSGRQLKTLFQRLKGKEGRFRYNLSGKRVNFSARTVVSPDPELGINMLGVPESIAAELTVPVGVTAWNKENLEALMRANPEKISYVIRPDGRRKKLTTTNMDEIMKELAAGYIVERQLMDGDLVIFNRQPSLHRVSMMSHRVKVLPGKTFRFNVADCEPYNADFDGDEMNLHVPQNEEAQSEADLLMRVQDQVLSPRNGEPIIKLINDQITGMYILTQPGVKMSKLEAAEILSAAGIEPDLKEEEYTGKQIFSFLLPDKLSKTFKNLLRDDVKVVDGELTTGDVDGKVLRALLREIVIEFGSDEARKFLDASTKLSLAVVTNFGLTLSLRDYDLSEDAEQDILDLYNDGKKKVRNLVRQFKAGTLEREPGKTRAATREEKIMTVLEDVRNNCGRIIRAKAHRQNFTAWKKEFENNNAILMIRSGGKGNTVNVVQMCGLLGQQAVRGKRPVSGYNNRLLTHFQRGDLGDEAFGFVKYSFKDGLTPLQYFFHACGGRDSVVDKGVNPAKTGYMQRRLINALQDFMVQKDGSVKDAEGKIAQFKYGDDSLDPMDDKPIAPGEPVGVIAAQSIGEPGTQMTLRTFHYAGIFSLAQVGFNRMVEIVDARKTPKSPVMEVYLKSPHNKSEEKAKQIAASIEQINLEKIADIEEDLKRKVVRVTLKPESMKEVKLSTDDVMEKIKTVAAEFDKDRNVITMKPKQETLKNIRKLTQRLQELHLKGIQGINRAILIKLEEEWVLATEGSNLEEAFKIPEVDANRTTTNDITEISRVLGIEAGRNAIMQELNKVFDANGTEVNMRHVMMLADAMTREGSVKSVGRHGLVSDKGSVLARAAFEETAKHLINACTYGEVDPLNGITENIIIGQTIPCGTGLIKLQMKAD
ncbi:MAG TPA: DNA-directed RNA polymerase subunit A' [Candidatus Norongarragalinales archaeon]|jgi:DNA-directed RNA polymerase subunit A'|nr:DNA-directed RNA polymerase subunit A' [Candidatus Norongarragalinales archaeon]